MFFLPIVVFIVFFVVFLSIALTFSKSHKQVDNTIKDIVTTVSAYAEKNIEQLKEEVKKDKICEYCGSTISADSAKCSFCGAKVKK